MKKIILFLLFSFSINAQIPEVNEGEIISASKLNEIIQKLNKEIEGVASFGGTTEESVCNINPCQRYREKNDLAQNMIVSRTQTGVYDLLVSGFKPNSIIECYGLSGSSATDESVRAVHFESTDQVSDANGQADLRLVTTSPTSGGLTDAFFQIKCKGERP